MRNLRSRFFATAASLAFATLLMLPAGAAQAQWWEDDEMYEYDYSSDGYYENDAYDNDWYYDEYGEDYYDPYDSYAYDDYYYEDYSNYYEDDDGLFDWW